MKIVKRVGSERVINTFVRQHSQGHSYALSLARLRRYKTAPWTLVRLSGRELQAARLFTHTDHNLDLGADYSHTLKQAVAAYTKQVSQMASECVDHVRACAEYEFTPIFVEYQKTTGSIMVIDGLHRLLGWSLAQRLSTDSEVSGLDVYMVGEVGS